jgi:hypothetical protein
VKQIALTKGQITLVDDADYARLNHWRWSARHDKRNQTYYAKRETSVGNKSITVLMARQILGLTDPKVFADHIDGDTLNNQRYNLRPAIRSQSQINRGRQNNNTSGFKGVRWHQNGWEANIKVNGKKLYLGRFDTRELTHEAYKAKALELHKEVCEARVTSSR